MISANKTVRVGVIQMSSTDNVADNLDSAERAIREAVSCGASFVALPENFAFLRREGQAIPCAQPLDGKIPTRLCRLARELGIWLLGGTFPEQIPGERRVHNTSVLINAQGAIAAVYRKIHLFDVDLTPEQGGACRESDTVAPGTEIITAPTPFGVVGLSICYDLRFPELYREFAKRGATWITAASAFLPETGRSHWKSLLRARAIENQAFVLAPAQCGPRNPYRATYGHSMVIDAWGRILAEAGEEPECLIVDCDLEELERIRQRLPSLAHRRL